MNVYKNLKIKDWAVEDRPREKLRLKGVKSLSSAELIAILIGSGNNEMTAVDLSKLILNNSNNRLNDLGKLTLDQLISYKGVGEAKAVCIIAALELGKRLKQEEFSEKVKITSSKDVFTYIQTHLENLPHEEFWAIYLNQANKIIDSTKISHGGIAGTVTDIRIIFKTGLEKQATSVIVCHNHPSGSIQPSKSDSDLTQKIADAGRIIDIKLLDHLIIGEKSYFSFADDGLIR